MGRHSAAIELDAPTVQLCAIVERDTTSPRWARNLWVGVAAASVLGVALASVQASDDDNASSSGFGKPSPPAARQVVGTSALGCDVEATGTTSGVTTMTDPVCTREAIIAMACELDVSPVTPVEQYYSMGNQYLWTDGVSMAQFTTTVSSAGSTTSMFCQSGGTVQELQFTGDEWGEFNGVGTLSSTMRSKIEAA